jgi:hypothetical protein
MGGGGLFLRRQFKTLCNLNPGKRNFSSCNSTTPWTVVIPMDSVCLQYTLFYNSSLLVLLLLTGDALHSLRTNLNDPNNVLQSWDPTLVNPCTWFHVTCNNDNSVIRAYALLSPYYLRG